MFELFIMNSCPYCKKVIRFMNENNFKYTLSDISETENLERLIKIGGREQVPFLYSESDDIKMYESDDIIRYVKSYIG